MSDSQYNTPPIHAASPPQVSHPAASPESYQEDDLVESEDVEDFKGVPLGSLGPQGTLLDQITPRPQGDTDLLNTSRPNAWPGSETRGEFGSSNAWFNRTLDGSGNSTLRSFEALLDSPTGLTPKPGEYPPQLLNRQQFESTGLTPRTEQTYPQLMPQEFFPLSNSQYGGSNPVPDNYSKSLDKPALTNMYAPDASATASVKKT